MLRIGASSEEWKVEVEDGELEWRVEGMEPTYFRIIGGHRHKILPLHTLHTLHTLH
jgi:hypothetical protein